MSANVEATARVRRRKTINLNLLGELRDLARSTRADISTALSLLERFSAGAKASRRGEGSGFW